MKLLLHKSAKASHYNKEAESYDAFNESNSKQTNQLLNAILTKHHAKTVLDLSCGTGSQVFWLAKCGYQVVGADINSKMLKVANSKAKKENLALKFLKGDMRTLQVGKFDAVITIFNAVGHLTKLDFEETMRNVSSNLKDGGLYIFDINNLSFLMDGNNITTLTIDWQEIVGDIKVREIQYSTIDEEGILASFDTYYMQKCSEKPIISRASQTLQVYTAKQLTEMLQRNGFRVVDTLGIDGSKFIETKTERILMIAKKQK